MTGESKLSSWDTRATDSEIRGVICNQRVGNSAARRRKTPDTVVAQQAPASQGLSERLHSNSNRLWLVELAGFLYAVSMHKYAIRDPLSTNTGAQGVIEIFGTVGAFMCIVVATWGARRRYATSMACLGFVVFGIFSLCSSLRSYDPPLSFVKGILFLVVLASGYLASQADLGRRYFQAIYRGYIALLVIGLAVGVIFPHLYPLFDVNDYTGRTRLSVFNTFAGAMGEDAALFLLLGPVIQVRSDWLSQAFLFLMVVFAGGKTTTGLVCILLLIRFVFGLREWRSWRAVAVVLGAMIVGTLSVYFLLGNGSRGALFAHSAESIYGTHVDGEVNNLDGRLELWTASIRLLQDAQFLGYGFEGAREVMLRVASWSGNSHNGYLELALTGGLLGFAFFLFGLVSVIGVCLRARDPFRLHAGLIVSSILISDLLGSTFSFPSHFGSLILLFLYYQAIASLGNIRQASDFSPYGSVFRRIFDPSRAATAGAGFLAVRNGDSTNR